jgi:hypothetical protein
MLDCAREPALPAVAPELAEPRFAELEPCDGLWDIPVLPSGQSAALLLPLVPLRPELVPALLPPEREPEPMEPEPCEPLPDCMPLVPGALVPDPDPLLAALPPVCDQPG